MRVKKIEFSFWKNNETKKIIINNVMKMTWNGFFSL